MRCRERRGTAGSADHGGGGGTTEGLGGASKSIIPEEKFCGLCITSKCCMCVCACQKVKERQKSSSYNCVTKYGE